MNNRPTREAETVDSNSHNIPTMVPHGIFPASGEDSWVAIACRDDDDWRRLSRVVAEEWSTDPKMARLDGRVARREEIERTLADWTSSREAEVVVGEVRGAGVPVAAVASPPQRIDGDAATQRWGLWPTVRHAEIGDVRVDGIPLHLSDTDWVVARGGPCLGEHNRTVYGELLGLSDSEIDALASAGII